MPEEYVGTKFTTIFAMKEPPKDDRIDNLIYWCKRFHELGLAPGGAGNMSIRTHGGFIISKTGSNLGLISPSDFVEVLSVDMVRKEVTAAGEHEPSSESMMHAIIYKELTDAGAVFHGHHERMLGAAGTLGIPITAAEQPYGTPEIANEIVKVLGVKPFILIRNHGFVSMGATMSQAGRVTEAVLARLYDVRRP